MLPLARGKGVGLTSAIIVAFKIAETEYCTVGRRDPLSATVKTSFG